MYDYHNHTSYSDDSDSSIDSMIERAIALDIEEFAITDHYDPDYPDRTIPFELSFADYQDALIKAEKKYESQIKVIKGMEIGLQAGETLKKCRDAAKDFQYDFILGSFHAAEGIDLNCGDFFIDKSIKDAYVEFYTYVYKVLSDFKDYDVLAHLNIIDRYSPIRPPESSYSDIIDSILKLLVQDSKGIEINTSSFRYNIGKRTTPMQWMIDRYVELGGEIITTGSDAHTPVDVGYKLDVAEQMILDSGLNHVSTFKNRTVLHVAL